MDSHLFRRLAAELDPELAGRRIQKLFAPAPDVLTVDLGAGGAGRFLLLRHGNKEPLLFASTEKPRNPEHPEARVMWLRKRLTGRRLRTQYCDWAGRRLAWELSGQDGDERGSMLMLCLREGVSLLHELPPGFDTEPEWPDFEFLRRVLTAQSAMEDAGGVEAMWRASPQLSPVLRRTLGVLLQEGEEEQARLLYARLQQGEEEAFYVYVQEQEGRSRAEALAWRLPESLRQGSDERCFASACEAASFAGSVALFSRLSREQDAQERTARKKAIKRLKRSLTKVAQEERRLHALTELRRKGQALQSALWQLEGERKQHFVNVPDYEALEAAAGGEPPELRIELDPSLSVAANMERFFRLAAKGERGLPLVLARRVALERELDEVRQGKLPSREKYSQVRKEKDPQKKGKDAGVQRFRSSDGFTMLRGRNQAANHKLLSQAASVYDYWFHAQDGPGAHVVLKRDHPRQEVPRQSMLEAAALAGLKGWQAGDDRARVICALVKDVRKVKGAALGSVAVDKVLEAFQVPLDAGLEERLRWE